MIRRHWHIFIAITVLAVHALVARAAEVATPAVPDPAGVEFFETNVRPILAEYCYRCHGPEAEKPKGALRLDSLAAMLAGGSGGAAVVPGDLDRSLLIHAIRYNDEQLQMPPKEKLAAEQIAAIEAWVKMGAPFPLDGNAAKPQAPSGPVALTVEQGRSFWSFVKPVEPVIPEVKAAQWSKSPIDQFILARLETLNLHPSPQADRRTLIRRATYDLTGLPPTADEVAAFEQNHSTDAYEKLIDRLLASPRYGERWGRHWLDVARYADTKGYVFQEERRYPFSYTYRDWVIRAFNEDLPYDQFLIQQIAADKLELGEDKRPLAALGFLTLGRRFINNAHDIIDDRIDVVSRGTMGLTVSCARCHDHKYDPIPTADYYSLYGVFASAKEPRDPKELPLIEPVNAAESASPERNAFNDEIARLTGQIDAERTARLEKHMAANRTRDKLVQYLLATHESWAMTQEELNALITRRGLNSWILNNWRNRVLDAAKLDDAVFRPWRAFESQALSLPVVFQLNAIVQSGRALRDTTQGNGPIAVELAARPPMTVQQLAERYAEVLAAHDRAEPFESPASEAIRAWVRSESSPAHVAVADARQVFTVEDNAVITNLRQQIDAVTATHSGSPPRASVMQDLDTPVTPKIFRRGNPRNPGDEVPRQFLAVLSPPHRQPFTDSGRLEMAKLIASKDNPLTARVMVNRVWMYHFGAGLVRTPSDFGTRGESPTHPELLDWLALRFTHDDEWSIKKLHKRIMLSAAYQQASVSNPAGVEVDPENRLLWRQNPQRLNFEALRDSLLAASGQIDLTLGGRSVDILSAPFNPRRSVYAFIDRQNLPGLFRTFDFASPDATSAQRPNTSVPQQALFMMNSPFAIEQAKKLAGRADVASESEPERRIAAMYRAALGREAAPDEIELGLAFVKAEAGHAATLANRSPVWQYGYGGIDEATQRVAIFTPLPHFDGTVWSGGAQRPDPGLGWVMLMADGGHPGKAKGLGAIRRWVAPRDCTISVHGEVSHNSPDGDGVRVRLVTPREGVLAQWNVHNRSAGTRVTSISLKQGEALDFVVDSGPAENETYDGFTWKVTIKKEATPDALAGDDTATTWDSGAEFAGPSQRVEPMSAWEKYAQVLLESNEFAFVD